MYNNFRVYGTGLLLLMGGYDCYDDDDAAEILMMIIFIKFHIHEKNLLLFAAAVASCINKFSFLSFSLSPSRYSISFPTC